MLEEERLINLYEALGYCDVFEEKEDKVYDLIQIDNIKDLSRSNYDIRLKINKDEFNYDIPLIVLTDPNYVIEPNRNLIIINNIAYLLNRNIRLVELSLMRIE